MTGSVQPPSQSFRDVVIPTRFRCTATRDGGRATARPRVGGRGRSAGDESLRQCSSVASRTATTRDRSSVGRTLTLCFGLSAGIGSTASRCYSYPAWSAATPIHAWRTRYILASFLSHHRVAKSCGPHVPAASRTCGKPTAGRSRAASGGPHFGRQNARLRGTDATIP
jgi:hypothetical protein